MPIFEYACGVCGHEFEAFVTAERKPACPACESEALMKRFSSPGFVGVGESRPAPAPQGGCGAGGASCACRAGLN